MKMVPPIRRLALGLGSSAVLLQVTSCQDVWVASAAAGFRDGLVTTVTGIIEETFNARFGLEEEADAEQEGGNDLFVQL